MTIPQLLHFVVRNITYTPILTGYLVTCYTNNPCHLSLRWTSTVPAKHVNPRMVRGAVVGTYIDQCFVAYKDIEQNEAGDTFTHTFTVDPWPYCETRYFYFWGTVDGNLSPSASCIFYYHSTASLKYCYNEPENIGYRSSTRCTCISFPLKPAVSYTIRHWKTHLRRSALSTPQNTFEIWIWTADATGMPIASIGNGSKTGIVLPPWPAWLDIDFPISPTPVQEGGQYAISWRISDNYKGTPFLYLEQDKGINDVCRWNLPPGQGFYFCVPGSDAWGNCYQPPGPDPWQVHPGGGRQYFEAYGTPS